MNAENPADTVIKQAAKVLARRSKHSWGRDLRQAQDLRDAGLLADLAGWELRVERNQWEGAAQHNFRRAERVEAEVAELRAMRDRVEGLADECASSGCIHLNDMWGRIRTALDGAGEQ